MTSFYGSADIDGMLKEFGVPVSYLDADGQRISATVIRDERDEDEVSAEGTSLAAHLVILEFKTGSLPGIAAGSLITVESVDMQVVQVRQVGDGALTRAWCAPTT